MSPITTNGVIPFRQPGVSFDEYEHIYALNGWRALGSVTGIMRDHKISADWSQVPGDVLARKRDIGLAAHAAAHFYDEGDLDRTTIDPAVQPYLEAWVRFVEENDVEPLLLETPLVHPTCHVGGGVDRLAIVHRLQDPALPLTVPAVVDIKTGDPDAAAANVQTAAYEWLIRAVVNPADVGISPEAWDEVWPRYSVQLLPTGRYKLCTYTNPRDLHRFMWAYNLEASAHPSWRRK